MSVAATVCLLLEKKLVGYEVPRIPMADRVKPAVPGIAIGLAIMMAVSMMRVMYGTNIYCAPGTVFSILVYPYILKRYLDRTASGLS